MKKLLLVGAGGFGRVVLEHAIALYDCAFLDDGDATTVDGAPVIGKADCVIVAVGHNEYRSMSMMKIKELFKPELADEEKVLIDVKSLYRMDELKASGMKFWRL